MARWPALFSQGEEGLPPPSEAQEEGRMRNVLVTGGCGFIGSNFIRMLLRNEPMWNITNLDLLTYSGNRKNLQDVEDNPNYRLVVGDICNPDVVDPLMESVDLIYNFAAESHVDRSIQDASWFVRTNVLGTQVLLNAVKKAGNRAKFIQIGTDEVYGSIPERYYAPEEALLNPSSPYAASKAAADHIVLSFAKTYRTDAIITRSTNNYGPYQHPEKMIPLFVTNLLEDEDLPLYDDGSQVRDWLYVEDHCEAILHVLYEGKVGETYNIGGATNITNFDLVRLLCRILDEKLPKSKHAPHESLINLVADRPGHDRRYAMNIQKITRDLEWKPRETLESGLRKTVEWYLSNRDWVEAIRQLPSYQEWLVQNYQERGRPI